AGGSTSFDTFDAGFTVTEGVATFTKLALIGSSAEVTGKGNVNLPLWTIDMTNDIKLNTVDKAPSLQVAFKGPLDSPVRTFGQSALDAFFRKKLEKLVISPLIEKVDKKGIVQDILGLPDRPSANDNPAPAGETGN